MNEIRIHTRIHSRYRAFDASGKLPFSIVIGLCRRSPADTEPRLILLDIAGSVLDVPYALAHGLLTLHEQGTEDAKQWAEVNLSRLDNTVAKEAGCLTLPSPVNRTEPWRDAFAVYHYRIDVNSKLASILEPGKKYRIKLASEDLGVKRWAYSNRKQFVDYDGKPGHDSEPIKLVNSKPTAGNATFTVVESLSWPPRIEIKMRLHASSPPFDPALGSVKLNRTTALEVSFINTGSDAITVQTRGHQRFLIPWGLFQPEPGADDDRIRIIDATSHKPPTSSLQVVDSATGEVVRGSEQRGIGPLTDSNVNRRPKAEDVVTLKPRISVIKEVDIGALVDGLVDGQYKIRMQSRGCRWWHGEVGKEEGKGERITAYKGESIIPPLMLESQDEVEIRIRDGKIDQSM